MQASHMKQSAEDAELKLPGNKQSLYSGIKNIVKSSSGKEVSRLAKQSVSRSVTVPVSAA